MASPAADARAARTCAAAARALGAECTLAPYSFLAEATTADGGAAPASATGCTTTSPPPPASPPPPPAGGGPGAGGPPGTGGTGAPATGACADRWAPRSWFGRAAPRVTRASGGRLSGGSYDPVCRRVRAAPSRVTVAVARLERGRCRFLRANGRLGPRVACSRPSALTARGTTRWALALPRRLPRGTYVARVRGRDRAGNVERAVRTTGRNRNDLRFAVR